jgi:hypothetical protein
VSRPANLRSLFDDDDRPTTPGFDPEAWSRAAYEWASEPDSCVRPSLPTLSNEVGALPNEPEEDTLLRCFGCGARVLRLTVPREELATRPLDARHEHVLRLVDGNASIYDVLDWSELPRLETLRALEELVTLEVLW